MLSTQTFTAVLCWFPKLGVLTKLLAVLLKIPISLSEYEESYEKFKECRVFAGDSCVLIMDEARF